MKGAGDEDRPRRSRLRRLLPLAVLATGFALFFLLGFDRYLSFETISRHHAWLKQQVEQNALLAVPGYIGAYALMAAFSIPGGALLTVLGGFLFGMWLGTVYAVTGATIGSVAVFLAARTAIGDSLRKKAGPAIQRMREGFQEDALNYLLILRLIPVFPFWLVNLVPAFLGVRLSTYLVGTVVGIVPGGFVYASLGNGVGKLIEIGQEPDLGIVFEPEILIPIIGLAVLALLPVLYRKYRRRRSAPRR